jgi:hypothetical protein
VYSLKSGGSVSSLEEVSALHLHTYQHRRCLDYIGDQQLLVPSACVSCLTCITRFKTNSLWFKKD